MGTGVWASVLRSFAVLFLIKISGNIHPTAPETLKTHMIDCVSYHEAEFGRIDLQWEAKSNPSLCCLRYLRSALDSLKPWRD